MITIVAVDDSEEYLGSLKQIFKPYEEKYKLVKCISKMKDEYNIEYMLQQIGHHSPDVILMDLSFAIYDRPHDFGIELVRRIRNKYEAQKVIMLVGDDNDNDQVRWEKIRRSFEVGAMAYLGKRDIASWMEAIDEVVNGDTYVSPRHMQSILRGIRNQSGATGHAYKLGNRQLEVLMHLSQDHTIKQVANLISRGEDKKPITIHAVNFHLRNIRAKLNANTLHGVIAKAIREKIIE